jgi:hypothetical protein
MTGDRQLRDEIAAWRQAGMPARLWLRDDDATTDTPALARLLALTGAADVPVSLAVIPARADESLAWRLAEQDHVRIAVHGYAHVNHAPAAEKNQELGKHRPAADVFGELSRGRAKLEAMFADRLDPLLVPPWNRICDAVAAGLPGIGLAWLSTYAGHDAAAAVPGLGQLNCHVDLSDWRGGRAGKPWPVVAGDLARALEAARHDGGRPVGVLSHHLAHDKTAWTVLKRLLGMADVEWCSFSQLARLRGGE